MITILSTLGSFHPHKHTLSSSVSAHFCVFGIWVGGFRCWTHTKKQKPLLFQPTRVYYNSSTFRSVSILIGLGSISPIRTFNSNIFTSKQYNWHIVNCYLWMHAVSPYCFHLHFIFKMDLRPPDQQHQQRGATRKHCSGTRHFKWLVDIIQHVERTQYNSGKEIEREKELDCVSSSTLL